MRAAPGSIAAVHEFFTSDRAALRHERARAFLGQCEPAQPALIIAATVEAGSELVRSLRRPVFGWRRSTLFGAAAELARPALLERGLGLATPLSLEALWARVVFQQAERGELGRFAELADRPGLSRALARTATEVRALGLPVAALEPALARALRAFEAALEAARLVDRVGLFELAAEAVDRAQPLPVVLFDVPVAAGVEATFVERLGARASRVFACLPASDDDSVKRLAAALSCPAQLLADAAQTPLAALQQNLFAERRVAAVHVLSEVFSAPGESRECVEIARRVLAFAQAGVPFDHQAVLLRSPSTYRAPLEDAFRRALIPAYFSAGVPTPDPSGRALLALLRCAEEKLSARRFSEYLSLGQVPQADPEGAPPAAVPSSHSFERAEGETLLPGEDKVPSSSASHCAPERLDPDAPVTAGRLRSPRKWEQLIVDAAVIGGVDRWRRRLDGLKQRREVALRAPTLTEAQQQRIARELSDLDALEAFGLPLLDALAAFPKAATWGQWLELLGALATRALRFPRRVLSVLSELAPMGVVGPVELREVRAVLTPRLSEVTEAPAARRYGSVFVAPVEAARGLSFDVVFVPGLAERIFPQKVREDPLLPDQVRERLDERLEVNSHRVARERLALRLAVGAATSRAVLSWPRIDAEHARPRVPSFYALEAVRAVEGVLPQHEALQRKAELAGQARLAWPGPRDPAVAIDETEYDLAVLGEVLRATSPVKGRARYLVEVCPALGRALRARFARWSQSSWTPADGLVRPAAAARAALEPHQFGARPFSPTALEQYAACPYRFYLSTVLRLAPLELPQELEELGPLEKGSMTHEVHFVLLSRLRAARVRVTPENLEQVFAQLDEVVAEVTAKFKDDFVPAIARVWDDGVEVMRADQREWLRRVAVDSAWEPWRFELAFGLGLREQQDPSSVPRPVELEHGLQLRGSIDLVERRITGGALRATDYKTGRARTKQGNVVGGGRHLQPVLYAMVLEKLFPQQRIECGRLLYCTQVGGFTAVETALDGLAREHVGQVVLHIRQALETGFFPAMPADGECTWCDHAAVCGPDEERRVRLTKKGLRAEALALQKLRRLP